MFERGAVVRAISLLCAYGFLLAPSDAFATEHTAEIVFPPPGPVSQIGEPESPAAQQYEYDRQIGLLYNDLTGTVVLATEVYAASYWGERHEPVSFTLTPRCSAEESDELAGEWSANPGNAAAGMAGSIDGRVTIDGRPGSIAGTGSFDPPGGLLNISFQSTLFVGQQWACLTISSGGEIFTSMLSGYLSTESDPAVTAHRASRAQVAVLTSVAEARRADGLSARRDTLLRAWITNNRWASAEIRSTSPKVAKRARFIFRYARDRWQVVAFGSSPCTARFQVPAAVREALAIEGCRG